VEADTWHEVPREGDFNRLNITPVLAFFFIFGYNLKEASFLA